MTSDQPGTTDHFAGHGRSHIHNGCAVQACSQGPPATKDRFLWLKGVVVSHRLNRTCISCGSTWPPSGGLELPSGHLPGRQILCQLEGDYQGHCHEGLLGFPLVGSSCWCWALLNTLTTCQLPRVVFARGDTWAPQAGQTTAEGLSCWIQVWLATRLVLWTPSPGTDGLTFIVCGAGLQLRTTCPSRPLSLAPRGGRLVKGSTAHASLAGQPWPPSGDLELPSRPLPGGQILCQLEGVYQGNCHEGLLGFPLIGRSCWCWALLNTPSQLFRFHGWCSHEGDAWVPPAEPTTEPKGWRVVYNY